MSQNGDKLYDTSEEMKNDKDVVLAAVTRNGSAFEISTSVNTSAGVR